MSEPRPPRPPRPSPSRPSARRPATARDRPATARDGRPREGSPPPPPPSSGPRRQGGSGPRRLPFAPGTLVGLGLAAVLVLLLVVALVVRATHDGQALPGTQVAGVDLGGTTQDEAARRLRPVLTADRTLLLRADDKLMRVRLADAGYAVDLAGTASDAVEAGRGGFLWGLPSTLGGLVSSREVPIRTTVKTKKLDAALARVAAKVDDDPYPGALKIDPATREVTATTSRPGRAVDRELLAKRIRREVLAGRRGPIEIPLKKVAAVPRERLDELVSQTEAYLRTPLRLTGAGTPLELSPKEVASLLALEGQKGGRQARLGVDDERLEPVLDRVVARGDRPARNARVSAPAQGASLTDKGDISWSPKSADVTVRRGTVGRAVRRDALATAIGKAVREGKHVVRVPTTETQPAVSSAAAGKIDQLIGTFTTPYVAGQPRVTNIQRMARTVDETLVPVGGKFSLNGATGERTKAKGYVEAPFIAGNKIEPSVGGGVSQFATTMYNAAYFAGLQIDAFRPHSLYIDRYPPGRESTLNFPDIDMAWTNDTSAPILIRTSYDDAGVTVTLYGDNGGRKVQAKAGDREPVDGGNFQITVTRKVRYKDGRTVDQPVTTRYENEVTEDQPQE